MPADSIITTPPIAASTVAVTNENDVPVLVQIYDDAADISAITINGKTLTTLTLQGAICLVLNEGATIAITYANTAITWKWYSLT